MLQPFSKVLQETLIETLRGKLQTGTDIVPIAQAICLCEFCNP